MFSCATNKYFSGSETHFKVVVVSEKFENVPLLQVCNGISLINILAIIIYASLVSVCKVSLSRSVIFQEYNYKYNLLVLLKYYKARVPICKLISFRYEE